MRCPKCNAEIDKNQIICENCGTKINRQTHREPVYETVTDDGVVLLSSNKSSRRAPSKTRTLVIILSVLMACVVIAGIIVYIVNKKDPERESSKNVAVQTTEDVTRVQTTTKPTEAATKAAQTTAPETEATKSAGEKSNQDKIEDYIASSNVEDDILAESDGSMALDVFAENNILVAQYTVQVDTSDPEQEEYASTLNGYFADLLSKLDKVEYKLKSGSGVDNAELEVRAYDMTGKFLYSDTIS